MAIARDANSSAAISTTNDLTWSHTCTGANLILFVNVYQNNAEGSNISVTYAGVSMTSVSNTSSTDGQSTHLFYLLAPTTGANNVIIHCSSGNTPMGGTAASYTGVKQSGVPDASNTQSVSSTSATATLTTVADNCWAVMGVVAANAVTASTGSNLVVKTNNTLAIFDTNGVLTPPGSKSMSVTNNNPNIGAIMVSFAPLIYTLAMGQGSYATTGFDVSLSRGITLILSSGSYALTGFALLFSYVQKWIPQAKNTSVEINASKNSSTWADQSKNTSTETNQTKN